MKPLVTFPDAEIEMIGYLEQLWSARDEDFKPNVVDNEAPGTLAAGVSHLQVELDGTPIVEYPVTERATVRFTYWTDSDSPSDAKNGAAITQGLVAVHPGDRAVYATRILTGRLKGQDPDSKNWFVSFTARVTLRPTAL